VGLGLLAINALGMAPAALDARGANSLYWTIVYGLTLPALPFAVVRTRTARARAAPSAEELAQLLESEIDRALHLESVSVMLSDGERLLSRGGAPRPLPVSSALALQLAGRTLLELDLERGGSHLRRLPGEDREWLADTRFQLIVPLASMANELVGMIGLGPKRSELPFTADDRQLLQLIGSTAAPILENRRLRGSLRTADPADAESESCACRRCGRVTEGRPESCPECAGELTPVPVPGLVAGKFALERQIGQGELGVVYRALDRELGRRVAIKTLPRTSPEAAIQLRREARIMAALTHPNLEQIFGIESWRGIPMLVVELMAETLADRLARGPLPPVEVIALGIAAAEGLETAHRAGILHRDIKPSNLGFTSQGAVKLLDFGLAHLQNPEDRAGDREPDVDRRSATGVAGTPLYMSPELLQGEAADIGHDLWSLALVLFEAVAARHPFERGTWSETLAAITAARAPDPREFAPSCPAELATFFATALSPNPRARPASARELRDALDRAQAGLGS
jgi:hypothetical protein